MITLRVGSIDKRGEAFGGYDNFKSMDDLMRGGFLLAEGFLYRI